MRIILRFWVLIILAISITLFLWLRFNSLDTSYEFTGDPGRDMLVLWDWRESGKPPLLGPQTSAMPINQSAVYFYFLYPAFLLTGGNPISANYTVAFFWVVSLILGVWILRKRAEFQWVVLIVFALSSIHPIFVEQTRMVWNPSFLPPLITAAFISLFLLQERFTIGRLITYSLSMSLAVSLHFPVGAIALASLIYIWLFFKEKRFLITGSFFAGLLLFNLPTILFEMRHGFLISKSVLAGGWIGTEQFSRLENLKRLIDFSGGMELWWADVLIFAVLGWTGIRTIIRPGRNMSKMTMVILVISIFLTIISKMAFHSHYAFGFSVALFFLVSQLPTKLLLPAILILEIVWLNPVQTDKYFSPARRTIQEMEGCFQRVCETETEPLFVSVQSGVSSFHVGYEYRYLLKRAGCKVRYIESQPNAAKKMAVVIDDSSYEHEKTSFNELSLFGSSEISNRFTCDINFEVVVLRKL